jgi:hypothetical protein
MNSSSNVPTYSFISVNTKNKLTSEKVDRVIDTLGDIVNTFKTRGCPEGKELLRETLRRHHFGDSPWSIK